MCDRKKELERIALEIIGELPPEPPIKWFNPNSPSIEELVSALESDNAALRAELAALKPKWSKEPPKVAGWYFMRQHACKTGIVTEVWQAELFGGVLVCMIDGDEIPVECAEGMEFAGPLPEPEEPK